MGQNMWHSIGQWLVYHGTLRWHGWAFRIFCRLWRDHTFYVFNPAWIRRAIVYTPKQQGSH